MNVNIPGAVQHSAAFLLRRPLCTAIETGSNAIHGADKRIAHPASTVDVFVHSARERAVFQCEQSRPVDRGVILARQSQDIGVG